MDQIASENLVSFKYKKQIAVLSILALVLRVVSCINFFVSYGVNLEEEIKLCFQFPPIEQLLLLILNILPCILLVIYVQGLYKKSNAAVIVPIVFASIAMSSVVGLVFNIIAADVTSIITNLSLAIAFSVATIKALNGLSNKIFVLIPTVLALALTLLSAVESFSSFPLFVSYGMPIYIVTGLASIIANLALNSALLVFGLTNRIPNVISMYSRKKEKSEKLNPERALRALNDKLELGLITEEEYKAQRAEIISKL